MFWRAPWSPKQLTLPPTRFWRNHPRVKLSHCLNPRSPPRPSVAPTATDAGTSPRFRESRTSWQYKRPRDKIRRGAEPGRHLLCGVRPFRRGTRNPQQRQQADVLAVRRKGRRNLKFFSKFEGSTFLPPLLLHSGSSRIALGIILQCDTAQLTD